VDIDKELFKGKLTDLFALYGLGMAAVKVLGWSLDWGDAPLKGTLIVTVWSIIFVVMLTAQAAVSASETEGESVMNYRSDKFWL
jgi:hypothetical protein